MRKLLILLASLALGAGMTLFAAAPAQAAWTNSSCKQVDVSTICLDFNTNKIGTNSYRLVQVRLCLYSQTPNNNADVHNNHVKVYGSGGSLLGLADVPTVPRNQCKYADLVGTGGSGMTGHLTSTLNIDPWPPLAAPDIDYTMCRQVTQAGLC